MSIVEIAQMAGVSVSTVSRYFNRPEKLSPEAADKIRAAVGKANYQPDIRRPGPKTAERVGVKTGNIVFLSVGETSPREMLRMVAISVLLGSVQQALGRRRMALTLGHIDAEGRLPDCVDPRSCDGVILYGKVPNQDAARKMLKQLHELPAVWCFREHNDPDREFDHVFYDNRAVGVLAANYLAQRGHREVAVFNSTCDHTAFTERTASFLAQAKTLGMKTHSFVSQLASNTPVTDRFVELAARFGRDGGDVTGLFFCADDIMLGVYNELRVERLLKNRHDMIGCNADEVSLRYICPRPATIDIKMEQLGELAVSQLMARINGGTGSYCSEIIVKPEVVAGCNSDKQ